MSAQNTIPWQRDVDRALDDARRQNKVAMLDFNAAPS